MQIKKATKDDFPAIHHLLGKYGKFTVSKKHLNHRDISVVAYTDEGECVGFVWVGLMAGNSVAYVDKLCVSPEYARQKVGLKLAALAIKLSVERGVREVFGIIKQDKYHDRSAMNALRSAIGADQEPYTYVRADLQHMVSELQSLGQGV